MSQPLPLTDAEQEEKAALESIPCQGLDLTAAQAARFDDLSQRSKVPRPLPPGTMPRTVRHPKITTMICYTDPGVGGGPVA